MASKGGDRIMELKNRSQYLDKLISVQDMEVIKVVTGIRRCGKSSLLKWHICGNRASWRNRSSR